MKVGVIAVVTLALGMVAGIGRTWLEFAGVSEQFGASAVSAGGSAKAAGEQSDPRVVVVNGESHNFGIINSNSTHRHQFVFENAGSGVLKLLKGSTSCGRCTISELETDTLAPGESTSVTLEYAAASVAEEFRQTAEIQTSDPLRPLVQLSIYGEIRPAIRIIPDDVSMGSISANEVRMADTRIYCFDSEDFKIVNSSFTNPETAGFFQVQSEPLANEQLQEQPGAKSGVAVTLSAKPGLPLGPINQTIRLRTNQENAAAIEVPIRGTVVSDIAFIGPRNFDGKRNFLYVGVIRKGQGAKVELHLLVKGPYREEVKFEVGTIDPAGDLQATLGPPRSINDGAAIMYPLAVEVPRDSRAVNRLGVSTDKAGRIVIETTHPDVKQVPLYVRFAVEG